MDSRLREAFSRPASLRAERGLLEKERTISRRRRRCMVLTAITSKKGMWQIPHTFFGWDRWIRTIEMPESKSGALPLGYIPIFTTDELYHKI